MTGRDQWAEIRRIAKMHGACSNGEDSAAERRPMLLVLPKLAVDSGIRHILRSTIRNSEREKPTMARDTLEQARSVLQQRLKELRGETSKVEKALAALGDGLPSGRRPRAKGRQPARRNSRRRFSRSDQFVAALKKEPGAGVSEVAKKLGISSQQGHGVAKRLRDRGVIKKQGKGYAVKS